MEIYGIKNADMVSFSSNYNPTDNTSLLDQLFPNEKTENTEVSYLKIKKNPMGTMALVYSLDSATKMRSREPFSAEKVKKFLIKDKIPMDERYAEMYEQLKDNTAVRDLVFNDAGKMSDNVRTKTLVMKGEVLSSGKVTINENNVNMTVDFGVPTDNKFTFTWTTGTPDILSNILTMVDKAKSKGYAVTRGVTSGKIISTLRSNEKIRKAILGVNSDKLITANELNAFLRENFGFVLVAFDDMYRYEKADGTFGTKRYFPENELVLFGGSATDTLGKGLYGVTPTERMARISGLVTPVQSKNIYIYCDIWRHEDPEELLTRAEAQFIPVLADPDNLYIATIS